MAGMISNQLRQIVSDRRRYTSIVAALKSEGIWEQAALLLGSEVTQQSLFDWCYPDRIKRCDQGNQPQFLAFARGYAFCGRAGQCRCASQSVSKSVSSTKGEYPSERRAEIKEKSRATWLDRYGVTNPAMSQEVKDKKIATSLQTYGTKYPNQSDVVKKRVHISNSQRYLGGHHTRQHIPADLKSLDLMNALHQTKGIMEIAEEYGVHYQTVSRIFNEIGVTRVDHNRLNRKITGTSKFESEVSEFVGSIVAIERNLRFNSQTFGVYELDILVPDLKLAFECNGSYWHSELNGKTRDYHLNKTKAALEQRIRVVHIWEHEWNTRRDLVKSRIGSILGVNKRVYARQCIMRVVDSGQAGDFLERNHIQGRCPSEIKLGLFWNGDLIALMTLGRSRYDSNVGYELIRYCSVSGFNVVGGASRLFKRFVSRYSPKSVVSYSDIGWNTGNMYTQLGFQLVGQSAPAYYYTRNYRDFENRVKYQKHKLPSLLSKFDATLTEWANMQANGFDRIWDCGTHKYVWNSL